MTEYEQLDFMDMVGNGQPKLAVFDLETGGFNEKVNGIASFAVVRLDENLNEVDRHYSLTYEPDKVYEQSALDVNGLKLEQLQSEGWRPAQFLHLCKGLFEGMTIVGHNLQFDSRFFNARGFDIQNGICTMENDYDLTPYAKHKLGIVYNRYYGHDFTGAHDALFDVLATIDLLKWQIAKDPKYGVARQINWDRFKR
jgi:DNA polymerase III alpha subunit (gram-positive type)